jgi:hypothetical protein
MAHRKIPETISNSPSQSYIDNDPNVDPSTVRSRDLPENKRIGREIAFGVQQSLVCWATDFIDPIVSKLYQDKYGNKEHEVTHAHTFGGEIAGDLAAFFVYMGAKRLLTNQVDGAIDVVKHSMDAKLDKMGRKSLKGWAAAAHVSEDDPIYKEKLEAYKDFQAENIVDSSIIAGSSAIINVAAQRALGNKQALSTIAISKLIGTGATMGIMLGLRTVMPTTLKAFDDELSDRYFSKLVRKTKKFFGVDDSDHDKHRHSLTVYTPNALAVPTAVDATQEYIEILNNRFHDKKRKDPVDVDTFVQEQKTLASGLLQLFSPEGAYAKTLVGMYANLLRDHAVKLPPAQQLAGEAALDRYAETTVKNLMIAYRDEVLSQRRLLDDRAFLSELKTSLTTVLPPKGHAELDVKKMTERFPGHRALVELMDPHSNAAALLEEDLKRLLPSVPERAVHTASEGYIESQRRSLVEGQAVASSSYAVPRFRGTHSQMNANAPASYASKIEEQKFALGMHSPAI